MNKFVIFGILCLFAIAQGCFPVTLVPEYVQIGYQTDSKQKVRKMTMSVDEVQVFYKSSPKGFSIKENELKVESGFKHQILGEIKVRIKSGDCFFTAYLEDAIKLMKESAYENGANAVVYAHSDLPKKPNRNSQVCATAQKTDGIVGRGWAVIRR